MLVNNAGVTMWARFDAVHDFAVYERLLAVNYLGAVHMTAAALPHLKAARGLIVAVASMAGLTGRSRAHRLCGQQARDGRLL